MVVEGVVGFLKRGLIGLFERRVLMLLKFLVLGRDGDGVVGSRSTTGPEVLKSSSGISVVVIGTGVVVAAFLSLGVVLVLFALLRDMKFRSLIIELYLVGLSDSSGLSVVTGVVVVCSVVVSMY